MRSLWAVLAVALLFISTIASAQSPYVISGLHSDLRFTDAVARAEKLGFDCQITASGVNEQNKSAQCDYRHCVDANQAGGCEAENLARAGLLFALQPIARISLEAPADAAPVTRIVMVYNGDTEAVAAGLVDAFGPTEANGAPTDKKTWSNARRWSWSTGQYRMGLLDSPQLIILATDQSQALPGEDS